MKMKQINFVTDRLDEKGEITRNECLKNYISRLGAIIAVLKERGYVFLTEYRETITPFGTGKDYVYTMVKKGSNE